MTTLMTMALKTEKYTVTEVLIHRVIHEPQQDDDGDWFIVAQCEDDGQLYDDAVYSLDPDDLYEIVRHCKSKIEPFVIEMTWHDESDDN